MFCKMRNVVSYLTMLEDVLNNQLMKTKFPNNNNTKSLVEAFLTSQLIDPFWRENSLSCSPVYQIHCQQPKNEARIVMFTPSKGYHEILFLFRLQFERNSKYVKFNFKNFPLVVDDCERILTKMEIQKKFPHELGSKGQKINRLARKSTEIFARQTEREGERKIEQESL